VREYALKESRKDGHNVESHISDDRSHKPGAPGLSATAVETGDSTESRSYTKQADS
jgi:hypothetical protein